METTYATVRHIMEKYPNHIRDVADEYGEPGYGNHYTAGVIVGDFWCRCGEIVGEDGRAELHDIAHHYPRVFAALEENGWELEWEDEWVVSYDGTTSRAYRTQGDSYGWMSSIMFTEYGDVLTPEDDIAEWIAEVVDNPRAALTSRVWSLADLASVGFLPYRDEDDIHESGWHPGQTADPEEITAEIREELGQDVEIVFHIAGVGQFDMTFRALVRRVPSSHPVQPLYTAEEKDAARVLATCGECGLSWDDGVSTSITPTPAARCPFEYFHAEDGEDEWVHDPSRDGAGCSWCGGFAKVNADNLCRECHEEDEGE